MADIFESDDDAPKFEGDESDAQSDDISDEEILKRAKDCFKLSEDAESDIRALALEDIKFSTGEQWDAAIKAERAADDRPCLVINRIPQFIQQITNDQRQNRPAIKVHAVDDGADVDTAKIIQGLIRHIEYNSNAEVAYDRAFESAARGGFGYFRIVTDFVSPDSFDQEIYIKSIRNAFSARLDPNAQEPDGSDASWGFVISDYSEEEYRDKFPGSKLAESGAWESLGTMEPLWMKNKSARVAEFFYKVPKKTRLHLLSTGESVLEDDLAERLQAAQSAGLQIGIVKSRDTKVPVVKWVKLNALEILEKTDWPGKYIPIIPVYGNEVDVDGKRVLEGIVRNAKDPQRMLNYWKSAETESIALAPRAPFIGAEGQFEGHEKKWETANRRNHAFLEYKQTALNGQPAPPPQRQAFEPAVQAITQASRTAADDLKATTGIYDPSLGAGPADTSGVAIQKRNIQAQTANFHFVDNLTRSLRHAGRILVDLMPKIYDTARTARIIGEDGAQKIVKLNQPHTDENGKDQIYRLDVGTYDVTVDVGPSYASKRQEAAASMQSLAQSYPQIMQIAGDLFVKNMDWPGAQDIADRIRKTIPPNLVSDAAQGNQKIPPQIQSQMQQMSQVIDHLTQHLNETTKVLETKKLELDSRERIEFAKIQAQLEMKGAELGSKEDVALLNHQIQAIQHQLEMMSAYQSQLNQSLAPDASGGSPAQAGQGATMPTGGPSPGQPMAGEDHVN